MSGRIFIVGTPIGNLEDLTLRAKRVLSEVDLVICEDTRVTKKLLARYGLTPRLASVHHHTAPKVIEDILARVERGENVAVVTDAGMPGISDPGGKLVAAAIAQNMNIETVPGPSALTAALSLAGFPTDRFVFFGFVPHKKGRETMFARMAVTEEAVGFFESPHRLMKTLSALVKYMPEREGLVARELTKIHESVIRGTTVELLGYFMVHPDEIRGECVILLAPR